jgi:Tol biopolymer transport system component
MAKKDPDEIKDPEAVKKKALEEKVDSYMNVAEPEEPTPPAPETEIQPETKEPEITPELTPIDGAPLLPTEKLPDLDKPKKVSKIQVVDHAELEEKQEEPQPEPEAEEIAEPTEAEEPSQPEPETPEPVEELPEKPAKVQDDLGLEDVGMAKAVDEIVAAEADKVLEAEDKKNEPPVVAATPGMGTKIKHFFGAWWHNKVYRNATFTLFFAALIATTLVPASRYAVLNTFGVRASTSMVVLDDKTGQPLKNVEVSMSNRTTKTDVDGKAKLEKIKLGPGVLSIKKPAFAEVTQKVTIGWGSNPREDVRLTPVGSQYTFTVTDFLSGKPVVKAEATSGQASAVSNDKGEIILTTPQTDEADLQVQISAADYRMEVTNVSTAKQERVAIQMVPARKHAFVSKRDGTLDVYKIDADGKNEEKVLKGTGSEREESIALGVHPTKNVAALISTRDGSRNKDGFTLSVLTLINLDTNETKTLAQSERIQLVDWIGDRLVYVKIAAGQSAASPNRNRLISYDLASGSEKELASTNYFNDVVSARGAIYYTPAIYKVNGNVGLYRVNADGTNKKTVYNKEVWNIFRTSYDKLNVSVGQDWYEFNMDSETLSKVPAAPPKLKSRVYTDSPDGKQSVWVDDRDGKGTLIVYDKDTHQEKVIASQSGIKTPVRWLSNKHLTYRVTNAQETADYVVSLDGGEPKKIRDVTNTAGIDRWYYY